MLFVSVILLSILFINNIVLYKQKLKDRISVMLLTAVILGCFEILWTLCEGNPQLTALTYIGACGYMSLFVNIASYAYDSETGIVVVQVAVHEEPLSAEITFIDNGKQYDPLLKADPDITLPLQERKKGGLGIFMVKNTMDNVIYEYKYGKNILTIQKLLS